MEKSSELFPEPDKHSFEAAFAWWEKRRLRYNITVGIPGALMVLLDLSITGKNPGFSPVTYAVYIVAFAVFANACYCLGYLLEFFLKYYFRSGIDFPDKRNNLYWIGTAFPVFVVIAGGIVVLFAQPTITNFIK